MDGSDELLAGKRQMIPLDPPFADSATVGGVVAANTSGPRRRLYGTARDVIIGMKFATLEGKLVQSGGMVVKNVAGSGHGEADDRVFRHAGGDRGVNFKLAPIPVATRTFVLSHRTLADAIATRDRILRSVLQPSVIGPGESSRQRRALGWRAIACCCRPEEAKP